jgi:hypothetical protein
MVSFDLIRVTAVRHVREHVLWLRFSDGLEGEIDLANRLRGPAFAALKDTALFAQVRLEDSTITWPNGADWAPESLHDFVAAANGVQVRENDAGASIERDQLAAVPEISPFFGITIVMFYNDHARPHFHARFGGQSIAIEIDGDGVSGSFPPHRLPLVFEWRDLHRAELRENWRRVRAGESPLAIAPLS